MRLSWKGVSWGILSQFCTQVIIFFGFPLLTSLISEELVKWTALLTWVAGPLVGGYVAGKFKHDSNWVAGLFVGVLGTALLLLLVMMQAELWLISFAVVSGGIFGAIGAAVARAINGPKKQMGSV